MTFLVQGKGKHAKTHSCMDKPDGNISLSMIIQTTQESTLGNLELNLFANLDLGNCTLT